MSADPSRPAGVVRTIDEATLKRLIDDNPIVLLDFAAPGDPASARFAPLFAAIAARHPGIVCGRIDCVSQPRLALDFGVRGAPGLVAIRDQILVARRGGELDQRALWALVEQVCLLDMDDIRTELAAHEGDEDAIDW